jgi:hypothetical protein
LTALAVITRSLFCVADDLSDSPRTAFFIVHATPQLMRGRPLNGPSAADASVTEALPRGEEAHPKHRSNNRPAPTPTAMRRRAGF